MINHPHACCDSGTQTCFKPGTVEVVLELVVPRTAVKANILGDTGCTQACKEGVGCPEEQRGRR